MLRVHVCSKKIYEQELEYDAMHSAESILLYPEVDVSYDEWYTYFTENLSNYDHVVTQSSELLKFIEVFNVECEIRLWVEDKFVTETVDSARLKLLNCYELLMIKGHLFND